MATFHCAVKSGKSGTGGAHADYIEREGKYASKEKDDLEHKQSGNLPEWAESSADFWQAADKHERANGAVYREFEIALPRELTKEQRLELVREFVAAEIGDKHAYTFAIHNPKAHIEGGEQPHAHIMYSERTIDGIARPAEQYFKRWNAKNPERGGCQKATAVAKTLMERLADLAQLRERFAELQNKHLAKAGHEVRVTHLSLKAQGLTRKPEKDYGLHPTRAEVGVIREIRAIVKQTDDIERAYIQSKGVNHETRPLRNHQLRGEIVSLHDVSISNMAHVSNVEHFSDITPLHLPSAEQIDLREREADSEPVRGMGTESRLKPIKTDRAAVPRTPENPPESLKIETNPPIQPEEEPPLEVYLKLENAIDTLAKRNKYTEVDAKQAASEAESKVTDLERQGKAIAAAYHAMPKRPMLLGTKEWDAKRAELTAQHQKVQEAHKIAKNAIKTAQEAQIKAKTMLGRDFAERQLLTRVREQRPDMARSYDEGKRQHGAMQSQEKAG